MPETAGAAAAALQTHRSTAELWGLVPIALQMLGYGLALGRRLSRWHHQLRQHYSDLSRRSLRWLWLLFGLFTAVLVAWVLTWPLPVARSNVATNLLMAAVLALVGLRGPRGARRRIGPGSGRCTCLGPGPVQKLHGPRRAGRYPSAATAE